MKILNINRETCTKCALCQKECPTNAISLDREGYPEFLKESCLKCQHCLAICPSAALSIYGFTPENSLDLSKETMPTLNQIEHLMKGRRSIRFYKKSDISREKIDKLLDIAYHAPTGVNRQGISFKVIYTLEEMKSFSMLFYGALERFITSGNITEENNFLINLYNRYKENKYDVFFRNAPHLFFAIGSENEPRIHTDAIIASSYFELAVASAGYGAVWNGYITYAVNKIPEIRNLLKLKKNEVFCYAMCFGIPDVSFKRTVQRGQAAVEELKFD